MAKISKFIETIYEKNQNPSSRHYEACVKYSRISETTLKIGFSLYYFIVITVTLSGATESLVTGTKRQTMNVYFPCIQQSKYYDELYALQTIFNYLMSAISFITIPPSDMFFFFVFANISFVSTVICRQIDEFEERLDNHVLTKLEIKKRFLQYLHMHQEYNR